MPKAQRGTKRPRPSADIEPLQPLKRSRSNQPPAGRVVDEDDASPDFWVEPPDLPSTSTPPRARKSDTNVYARARSLLRLAVDPLTLGDGRLPGRDDERTALHRFLGARLPALYSDAERGDGAAMTEQETAAALYVSGHPGTGKTALLLETIGDVRARATAADARVGTAIINCTTVANADCIWSDMLVALGGSVAKDARVEFERRILNASSDQHYLIVLDEIDHLLPSPSSASSTPTSTPTKSRPSLAVQQIGQLFALAAAPGSRLTLIAVANALDLTQRASLATAFTSGVEPALLHFSPYDAPSLMAIARQRLGAIDTPLFVPAALELAARKVQAVSGDLRCFLDLLARTLTLAESAVPPTPPSSSSSSSSAAPVKVSPQHVIKAIKATPLAGADPQSSHVAGLVLHERLVLAALLVAASRTVKKRGEPMPESATVAATEAFAVYDAVMRAADSRDALVPPVGRGEWEDLVGSLKVKALIVVDEVRTPTKPRSSSSSSSSPSSGRTIRLAGIAKLADHVRGTGNAAACSMARTILDAEARRVRRQIGQQQRTEGDVDAPSAGFHGNGLDGRRTMGERAGHRDDES